MEAVKGKRYTAEEREVLIAEYNLSSMNGMGMTLTAFCKQPGKPSYPIFKKWLEDASGDAPVKGASKVAGSLQAEFEQVLAQEETKEQKFLKFLKAKQIELQAALAEVEREIAKRESAAA